MRISFLSGTRADYSKIKPYIEYLLNNQKDKDIYVFTTCMHMLKEYGDTRQQIEKDFGKECRIVLDNEFIETNTSQEMAHIISAYDKHLKQDHIDFVFVHGDRPEALAGAIAARLNNIPVCQIEAGDLSGSIDDSIRHSISKLAHRFLVADKWAKKVLLKMGESQENIFIVGNSSLANEISNEPISKKYEIPFEKYAILIYHPVTTITAESIQSEIEDLMKKLEQTDLNYIVIMPNNDLNHQVILKEYQKYAHNKHFLFFESLPLEVFTNLLKKATFLIGNSSCGIKEAPYYSVPVIDIGSRQQNRYQNLKSKYFHHLDSLKNLDRLIKKICKQNKRRKQNVFRGTFFKKLNHIFSESFWMPALQKNPYALIKKNRIKKFFYKIFFLIILCGVALLFFSAYYKPKDTNTAHIYIDLASIPSLFQMVDAVQQNSKDPKLFILKRFSNLNSSNPVLKTMHAQMVSTDFLGEYNYDKFSDLIDLNLKEFYKQHPNYQFNIHLNAHHALLRSGHFFGFIPIKQIKSVHLYDDAIGRSMWDKTSYDVYKKFSKMFNTYFHTSYYDPQLLPIKKEKIIPMDFSVKLPIDQQQKLIELLGIDFNKLTSLFNHRPVAVFLDDPALKLETAENFIKKMIQEKPEIKNYTWFYKNHPRTSDIRDVFKILKKYFKNVTVISNFIPIETLLLIGLPPDYIAGYGSSVFYAFKKEQILGYIKRSHYEYYLSPLLKLGILAPKLVFEQ